MFEHFAVRSYECGGRHYHCGEFDERFYGPARAARLNSLYEEWRSAEAAAEAYYYERDERNQAAAAAYSLLIENLQARNDMNILDAGILKYLSGDMLKEQRMMAFIADVRMEEITQGKMKPVLYLKDKRLGIVLNAGNTRTLAAAYGMETDAWRNQAVIVYAEQGRWFGVEGWAIRLAIPTVAPSPTPAPAMVQQNMEAQMAEAMMGIA